MTDITELAQSKALHKKLNRRLNDALGFQRTSGGKHTTISLSIDECKSVLSDLDERFALVEALEKAQQRIAELESRTVTVKLPPRIDTSNFQFAGSAWNCCIDEVEKRLTAAGIKVEVE